jgi:protein tyrosine/serine phosphatase
MTQHLIDPRELTLEGSVNFRDLGGLLTGDGQRVRTGLVYRSDALHGLTTADMEQLATRRIALIVDLRATGEIERSGPSPLVAGGSRVLHAPIMREAGAPPDLDRDTRMEVLYAHMLEGGRESFGEVFTTLAQEANLPAVIHCAAGKDRTGVTVALLLRLLGVPDEAIVLDYALTDRNMVRLIERLELSGAIPDGVTYPPHFLRAAPETMEAFLAALDHTWGSVDAYLTGAGVMEDHIATLRHRLLELAA